MKDTYRINYGALENKQTSFNGEKTSFIQGSYKTFSNGYLKTCNDQSIKEMYNKIDEKYSKIEKGYVSISNWLETYIQDTKRLEESLKVGTSNVTDGATKTYLNSFVEKNQAEINNPTSIELEKENYNYESSDEEFYYVDEEGNIVFDYDSFIKATDEKKAEYEKELAKLEAELRDMELNDYGNSDPRYDHGKSNERFNELKAKIDAVKSAIAELEYYKKEAKKAKELEPYDALLYSDEYFNFLLEYDEEAAYEYYTSFPWQEYHESNYENVDFLLIMEHQLDDPYGTTMEDWEDFVIPVDGYPLYISDLYNYTTDEQKEIYHYLFKVKGAEAANEYLKLLLDDINKASGAAEANEWIEAFKEYYASQTDGQDIGEVVLGFIASYSTVKIRGLKDGLGSFADGVASSLVTTGYLSPEEYAAAMIREYLYENTNFYGEVYDFNASLGNMLPAIAASALVTALATPLAGKIVGSTLMGISAAGNARHQALVNGASGLPAFVYGLFSGASEAILGFYLGKIPGLSETSGLTVANLLSEGLEELSQEYVDGVLRAVLLGEPFDLSEVTKDGFKAFAMGVAMAGYTNGFSAVANGAKKMHVIVDGELFEISYNDLMKAIDENSGEMKTNPAEAAANINKIIQKQGKPMKFKYKQFKSSNIDKANGMFDYYDVGYHTFGVDQHYTNSIRYTNRQEFRRLVESLKEQGFTQQQAKLILRQMDSTGACSYAAVCNGIFSQYRNNPQAFKQKFGFDMYIKTSDGKKQLNVGQLLVDMYIYENSLENGGGMFYTEDGKKYMLKLIETTDKDGNKKLSLQKTHKLYTENQVYMSKSSGLKSGLLNNYLKSKGTQLESSHVMITHYSDGSMISDSDMQNTINNIENNLRNGYEIHLGIYKDPNGKHDIRMKKTNGIMGNSTKFFGTKNHPYGHAIYVTGTTNEGLLVSSWGESYLIPYEDLQFGYFEISAYRIKTN